MVIFSLIFLNFGFFPLKSEAVSLQDQGSGDGISQEEMMAKASEVSLSFVPNRGQLDSAVKYSAPFLPVIFLSRKTI